jgi:hypothetical protein
MAELAIGTKDKTAQKTLDTELHTKTTMLKSIAVAAATLQ